MTRTLRARRTTVALSAAALCAVVSSAIVATPALSAPSPTALPCPAAYPLSSVTTGLTGVGFTVVTGTEPKPFGVEILGVLDDGIALGKDMIMVRLYDLPGYDFIAEAGGGWAGMSGSPIYVDDKLIGSFSYGFTLAPSPIGGVTPAAYLYDVLGRTATPAAGAGKAAKKATVTAAQRAQWAKRAGAAVPKGDLQELTVPLGVSGVSSARVSQLQQATDKVGWNVKVYRSGRSTSAAPQIDATPQAGGNFAGAVSYGDVTLAGTGTTTAVCGSKAVAFGHPLTFGGPVTYGASDANSLAIVRDNTTGTYKLSNVTGTFGTLDQDRLAGIRADLTAAPKTSAVTSIVRNTDDNRRRIGTSEVTAQDWIPTIAYYGAAGNADVTFDEQGGGIATSSWTITGTRRNGSPFVLTRANRFADRGYIGDAAADDLAGTLDTLINNEYEELTVQKVSLASKMSTTFQQLSISKIEVSVNGGRYSTPRVLVVQPGARLAIRVSLKPFRGTKATTTTLAVRVPNNAKGRTGSLSIVGGEDAGGDRGDTSIECLLLGECSEQNAGSLTRLAVSLRDAPRNDSVVGQLQLEDEKTGVRSTLRTVRTQPLTVTGSREIAVVVR